MKLLLDENLPHKLRTCLPGHEVFTAAHKGWAGLRNGDLLARAAAEDFDGVLTLDTGIEYEQNLSQLPCSVVLIGARSNAFEHIQPKLDRILDALASLQPRSFVRID